jgi:CelD/BcsL family acetyltransferase involved in cellulose biosynthesis
MSDDEPKPQRSMSQTPPPTSVRLVWPADLDPEEISDWATLQRDCAQLGSPFFHPQFTLAVGEVRGDVEVAVMEQDGRRIGFFPFHRDGRVGRPIGLRLSDFHGVIARPEAKWDAGELVAACGLRRFQFDHLLAEQSAFDDHHLIGAESPYMDFESGWGAYAEERRSSGTKKLLDIARLERKIERDVGSLRFEFHTPDDFPFQKLIEWKSQQQERTDGFEVFRLQWIVHLLERVRSTQSEGFSGAMSALYADGELVAVHLGMQSSQVFHSWFPAFNRDFDKYSPGLIHLVKMGQACAERGIGRLDLGKGPEPYKQSFKSGSIPLAEGAVNLGRCGRLMSAASFRGREWLRSWRLKSTARATRKVLRRCSHWKSPT